MKQIFLFSVLLFSVFFLRAQVVNTGVTDNYDSLEIGKVHIGGMVDTYYGYDFNEPQGASRPYFVSSGRHNEINVNLAYIDLKYKNNFVRAHLVPGFGTYVNDNYASEKGSLKNLVEASAGVKISKKKEIWVDAGILGSPYTNETPVSKDHLMYTRSLAAEYVPYYLTGVKLSVQLNKKWNAYLYVVNGWQQIFDNNNPLSVGTQVEYRPNDNILINWDTYIGDEYSVLAPDFRTRYFTDLYVIYKPKGKFSLTSCAYVGMQDKKNALGEKSEAFWGQANIIVDYQFKPQHSLSARAEYFSDPASVMALPITAVQGFEVYSASVGYNLKITGNALFRVENRLFFSPDDVYINPSGNPVNSANLLIANLSVWF